jgi:UDP-2,3-diacylglucosamine hydrolase
MRDSPCEDAPTVPHYFASDVHLRHDRPDRDRRFRAWLAQLTPDDSLVIVGDLCDFWMGSRRAHEDLMHSESLQALAEFTKTGGSLAIMAGNHDEWLRPFYEWALDATIIPDPHEMVVHGIRLHIVHGHLLGARRAWKAWMESRAFFDAFAYVPTPLAKTLDQILAWRNERGLDADEERHLRVYHTYAEKFRETADIVIFGHVHRPVDVVLGNLRLIVLGGWQRGSSFLKIDEAGATYHAERARDHEPPASQSPC